MTRKNFLMQNLIQISFSDFDQYLVAFYES